ncbi:hypothetical protein FGG08_003703 [Glutinoglossum americanum]|uniref:Uncharacterized protein n=1 Tax=Glutinoglossum americanum TaxID=1670608 RepID=A0A9P8I226_9PEZI|nr:hypothetical protein FGG08_003703 [Glutinoglossum americanum]
MSQNSQEWPQANFLCFRSNGSMVTIENEAYMAYNRILAGHVGDRDPAAPVTSVPKSTLTRIVSLSGLPEATQTTIRNLSSASSTPKDPAVKTPEGHLSWQEAFVMLYFVQLFSGSVSLEELLLPASQTAPATPVQEPQPAERMPPGRECDDNIEFVAPVEWNGGGTFWTSHRESTEGHRSYAPTPRESEGGDGIDEGASESCSRTARSVTSTATATTQRYALPNGSSFLEGPSSGLEVPTPGLEPAPIRDVTRRRLADLAALYEREQRGTREKGVLGFFKNRKQDVQGIALGKGLEEAVVGGTVAEVEAWLELGADVNCRFDGGRTSIHHAISQRDILLLKLLLSPRWHANPAFATYGHAHTPLYLSVKAHHITALPSTLLLLKAQARIDKKAFQAAISDEREELLEHMLATGRAPVKDCLRHAVLVGNVEIVRSFLDILGKAAVSEGVRNECLQIAVDARNLPLVRLLAPAWTVGNCEAFYRAMKSVAKRPSTPTTTTPRQPSPAHTIISHILTLCPAHSPTAPQRRHILDLAIASGSELIVQTLLSNHPENLSLNVAFKFGDRRFRDKTAQKVAEDLGMNKIADMIITAGGFMGGISFYPGKGPGGPLGESEEIAYAITLFSRIAMHDYAKGAIAVPHCRDVDGETQSYPAHYKFPRTGVVLGKTGVDYKKFLQFSGTEAHHKDGWEQGSGKDRWEQGWHKDRWSVAAKTGDVGTGQEGQGSDRRTTVHNDLDDSFRTSFQEESNRDPADGTNSEGDAEQDGGDAGQDSGSTGQGSGGHDSPILETVEWLKRMRDRNWPQSLKNCWYKDIISRLFVIAETAQSAEAYGAILCLTMQQAKAELSGSRGSSKPIKVKRDVNLTTNVMAILAFLQELRGF